MSKAQQWHLPTSNSYTLIGIFKTGGDILDNKMINILKQPLRDVVVDAYYRPTGIFKSEHNT